MKSFTFRDVCKLVGLVNSSNKDTTSEQSNLSIRAGKMKCFEMTYLPDLPVLPSTLTFNFDNLHQENEDYVSYWEFIIYWIVTILTELLLCCSTDFTFIELTALKY